LTEERLRKPIWYLKAVLPKLSKTLSILVFVNLRPYATIGHKLADGASDAGASRAADVSVHRFRQCERTFVDKMTGTRFDRPAFEQLLDHARAGDVILIWRLDCLGRSLKDSIETMTLLQERGIELHSLKEQPDTTTPAGKLMFHAFGALAEFERDLISERTMAGLEAARARGRRVRRLRACPRWFRGCPRAWAPRWPAQRARDN